MEDVRGKRQRSISYEFKMTVVILLFLLTIARFLLLLFFPLIEIISDKILLSVLLVVLFYLWIQELKDYSKLLRLNEDLRQTHEQLKQAEIDTIASLVKTVEAKDIYTRGHSERVTAVSLAIAEEMRLSEQEKKIIARAGILHDIGKIGIVDAILLKKDKLTDEEWQVIKSHPEKAIKILNPLRFLHVENSVILSHHERYDGKGYPQGLKGEAIPQAALILAVADAFDAMNSERPYRKPLRKDEIMAELIKGRGSQHSPRAVDALLSVLDNQPNLWQR